MADGACWKGKWNTSSGTVTKYFTNLFNLLYDPVVGTENSRQSSFVMKAQSGLSWLM